MGTIAQEISRIQTAKSDLKTAIENKGVTVPDATLIDGYAALVDNIQQGGSAPVLTTLEVYDNGTYTPGVGTDGYNEVIVNVGGYSGNSKVGIYFKDSNHYYLNPNSNNYKKVMAIYQDGTSAIITADRIDYLNVLDTEQGLIFNSIPNGTIIVPLYWDNVDPQLQYDTSTALGSNVNGLTITVNVPQAVKVTTNNQKIIFNLTVV